MIWQNPWAWAGLIAIALPVLIHLLGRGHAHVQRFPTLRFLDASRLLPTRRTRVHDLLLLAVRIGILAAAVAGLAQPLLLSAGRTRALDHALARAIVVDTSASMLRPMPAGERAVDAARREAVRLAGEAQTSTVLESGAPSRAIAGALAWLVRQPARAELVVLSDFQLGTIDSSTLAVVPRSVGIRLARIVVNSPVAPIETRARFGAVETVARITPSADRTDVEWSSASRVQRPSDDDLVLLAGAAERVRADAAASAAGALGVRLPTDSTHARAVAVVYPQYDQRAELLRRASSPRQPWMVDVVARLRSDSMLSTAASSGVPSVVADSTNGLVVARTNAGRAVVIAAEDTMQGRDRLLLWVLADAGSLTSAALIAATHRSLSVASALSELEPSTLTDETLASWQRAPAADAATRTSASANTGASDGRWFWIVALLLLALETWLRRAPRESVAVEVAHDRAA